jgi:sialic acid synthase SpsE
LNKSFSDFRDHQLSADPAEMRQLVQSIRLVSSMLGKSDKEIQPCEASEAQKIRRSIVASRDLPQGHCIGFSDLGWTRPARGLAPGEEHLLVGKRLRHQVGFGNPLLESDVE